MVRFGFVLMTAALMAGSALAAPAITTANVNFRSGPGTGFGSLGQLVEGTAVDLGECDDSGAWCAVSVKGEQGFVSGKYLNQADATTDRLGWPASIAPTAVPRSRFTSHR
ncbi:SH3 domain-containing protein (plasmid) [Rhizobium sp. RCAM05350]|nr:SH3 domain-containing protein [Rhizobium sp. RCAM05350]